MDNKVENDEEGFAGAFVKEPVPGLYEWVYSLDLQSLYPSIIMSLNISPETKIGFVTNWNVDKHTNEQMTEYLIRGTNDDDVVRLSREAFLKYMRMENLMISSNGVLYNGNGVGIIPEVLDRWFADARDYALRISKADSYNRFVRVEREGSEPNYFRQGKAADYLYWETFA